MINVFAIANALGTDAGVLPAVSQSNTPVLAAQDLLLIFNVTTLTGTSPTLQVLVEQFVAGAWVAVTGGTQSAVSAAGLVTYLVRGGFGIPWRIRVVPGGTVTAASFTLSKWAGTPAA